MIQKCAGRCRWCPLVCVVMGLILLLVGYDAEVLRGMWLFVSALMVICGIIMLIAFQIISKK